MILIRRLLVCAWEGSNHILMHEVFIRMSEERKADPVVLYMRFKLAVSDGDGDTGKEV